MNEFPAVEPLQMSGDWRITEPYIDAILLELNTVFGDRVITIQFYAQDNQPVTLPGLLLDIEQFELGINAGDNRTPALASLALHCLLARNVEQPDLQIRSMVAEVITCVHQNKWGLAAQLDYPENITATSEEPLPDYPDHLHWRIGWQQNLHLTSESDQTPAFMPEECYSGITPETGSIYVEEYEHLKPICESH